MENIKTQIVDLTGLKTGEDVLLKFGEIFEFGGPDGNISVVSEGSRSGWGVNWDAFNDCLRYLEEGGIWLTSKRFTFPLEIRITHFEGFKANDPKSFIVMREILGDQADAYARKNKKLIIAYN